MSRSDPDAAMTMTLIDGLTRAGRTSGGGYLLADATHDTNTLHAHARSRGFQLLTPRRQPGVGLGHRDHDPARLRCIDLMEGPSPFGRSLYARRADIERSFGHLGNFGGGLQPLPNFVRRPRRVALWLIAKLLINGVRICRLQGLTP